MRWFMIYEGAENIRKDCQLPLIHEEINIASRRMFERQKSLRSEDHSLTVNELWLNEMS